MAGLKLSPFHQSTSLVSLRALETSYESSQRGSRHFSAFSKALTSVPAGMESSSVRERAKFVRSSSAFSRSGNGWKERPAVSSDLIFNEYASLRCSPALVIASRSGTFPKAWINSVIAEKCFASCSDIDFREPSRSLLLSARTGPMLFFLP